LLIAGLNFGYGSSRENAVWGLQQFGIQAVIASNVGEIVYSNAMNSRLTVVILPEDTLQALMDEVDQSAGPLPVTIDVQQTAVSRRVQM
jgi:3-isopropylmalate/(R)-2-methylmalate dehydratase small subunit